MVTMHIKLPFYSESFSEKCREFSTANWLVIIEDNLGIRNLQDYLLKVLITNKMGLKGVTKLLLNIQFSAIGTPNTFVNSGLKHFYEDHAIVLTFLYCLFERLFKDWGLWWVCFPFLTEKFKIPDFSLSFWNFN